MSLHAIGRRRLVRSGLVTGVAVAALCSWLAAGARAGLILSIPNDITVSPGGTGSFNLSIYNPDSTSYDVAGFDFGLTVGPPTGVSFTGADTSSPGYLFAGVGAAEVDPIDFPFTTSSFPGSSLFASDFALLSSDVPIDPGQTFTLGRVVFEMDSTVPVGQHIPVAFDTTLTDLSDASGGAISFDANNGTITATPEPAGAVAFAGIAVMALAGGWLRRRRAVEVPD